MRCSREARRIDSRRPRTRLSTAATRRSERFVFEEAVQNGIIWVMHSVGVLGQRERGSIQGASWTILGLGVLRDTVEDTSFQGGLRRIFDKAY